MLDYNLQTFFIADATDGTKHHATFYQTRSDSEPEPAYSIRHPDPSLPNSHNCYAAALFDPYAADVLYGEVLIHPKWSQPTLSQEEIRRNNGVPPPPDPSMPQDFTVQLYNPDQQIQVVQRSGQLLGSTRWEFSMPQDTFRTPSSSMLDKSQNDPGATVTTPRINFAWKKDNKFTKELNCYVTGKSTDVLGKKKSKEPDIAIATFKGLREMTVYEPNLYRVDMEDPKGLEVTILLTAAVIRDVFFGNVRQVFNISDITRRSSGGTVSPTNQINGVGAAVAGLYTRPHSNSLTNAPVGGPTQGINKASTTPQLPITDARTQWELDAETARLRAQVEAEQREERKREEMQRKERERADSEEAKRLQKIFEQEGKERKAQQKRIDRETERLRREYGQQIAPQQQQSPQLFPQQTFPQQQFPGFVDSVSATPSIQYGGAPPPMPPRPSSIPPQSLSAPPGQHPFSPVDFYTYHQANYNQGPQPAALQGLYQTPQAPNAPLQYQNATPGPTGFSHSLETRPQSSRRKSFLNLRNFVGSEDSSKLSKKSSSVF